MRTSIVALVHSKNGDGPIASIGPIRSGGAEGPSERGGQRAGGQRAGEQRAGEQRAGGGSTTPLGLGGRDPLVGGGPQFHDKEVSPQPLEPELISSTLTRPVEKREEEGFDVSPQPPEPELTSSTLTRPVEKREEEGFDDVSLEFNPMHTVSEDPLDDPLDEGALLARRLDEGAARYVDASFSGPVNGHFTGTVAPRTPSWARAARGADTSIAVAAVGPEGAGDRSREQSMDIEV